MVINLLNNIFADNLLPLKVKIKRNLLSLHTNYFFIIGLLVKLLFVLVAIPKTHSEWFIPFLDNSISNLNLDPWNEFLKNNSNESSFPYGISMLLAYWPLTFFGKIISNLTSNDYFLGLGFRLSTLIFDYAVLILLSSLTNFRSNKILLFSYWCSPLIIYITYFHGQLDIVPIMFLVFSICMVKTKKYITAGLLISLAISSKLSMIIAYPLILIYLLNRKGISLAIFNFLIYGLFGFLILIFPLLFSEAYQLMVLKSPEIQRLFLVNVSYGLSLKVYIVPIIYILTLYLIWRLQRITQDLFLIATGLSFFSLLIFLPPATGWLLWTMPFLVYYQIISGKDFLGIGLLFSFVALGNNIFISSGASLIGFTNFGSPVSFDLFLENSHFKNLLFTGQQGLSLLIAIRMYIYGLQNNSFYKLSSKPLVISITNNMNLLNNKIEYSIYNLLGKNFTSSFKASSFVKKAVGYNFSLYAQNEKLEIIQNEDINFSFQENNTLSSKNSFYESQINQISKIYRNVFKNKIDYFLIKNDLRILPINIKRIIDLDLKLERVESLDEIDKKDLPANTSKIIFYLVCLGPRKKEKLVTFLPIGFLHAQLLKLTIAICAIHVETEISSDECWMKITFEGESNREDIIQIAKLIIPRLEDLRLNEEYWDSGNLGLMQIILIAQISDLLQNNNNQRVTNNNYA